MTTVGLLRGALAGALWAACGLALAADLVLHVAPNGSDTASGREAAAALASLEKALEIARRETAGDVLVRFASGRYTGVTLKIEALPGGERKLVLDGQNGTAEFDGQSGQSTWLQLRASKAMRTHVTVRGFKVAHYRQAIHFLGDRRDREPWSSGNVVENNVFESIGQFREGVEPALAALHLLNTRDTVIRNNRFIDIRNLQRCDGLHAIYMAGGSSGNRIEGNVFDGGCGDTIKVRDRSDGNIIAGNTFRNQSGKSLLVDSFCDGRKMEQCRDTEQECPSWNNRFEGNQIDEPSRRQIKAVTRHVGSAKIASCPLPGDTRILAR